MPPRAGRSRNTNYEPGESTSLGQSNVLEGPSGAGYPHLPPTSEPFPMGPSPSYTPNYATMEPQAESLPVTGERPFIPDIPVSIIDDPRSKSVLKGSLNKLVTDVAPGARLEDDAAELLLYVANDFLNSLANFSCRLASHRGSENLDIRDVELYLERMHGMRISLSADSPPAPAPAPPTQMAEPTPHVSAAPTPVRKQEPSPPLAQSRPRRHTNATHPDTGTQDDGEDDDDQEDEEEEEGGENPEEGESDEEKPRESRRLRERAAVAEKQKRKRGRPRK